MQRPTPIDEEIILDNTKYIESATDLKGIITDCNDYFAEISRYSKEELIGQPHSIVRHPDMPKIAFKILWDRLKAGQNINLAVKNLAKDGRYYWVFTHFDFKKDINSGEIIGYVAYRKTISKKVTDMLLPIYKKLVEIEKTEGMEGSGKYLQNLLEEHDLTIDTLLDEIYKLY